MRWKHFVLTAALAGGVLWAWATLSAGALPTSTDLRQFRRQHLGYRAQSLQEAENNLKDTQGDTGDALDRADAGAREILAPRAGQTGWRGRLSEFRASAEDFPRLEQAWTDEIQDLEDRQKEELVKWRQTIDAIEDESFRRQQNRRYSTARAEFEKRLAAARHGLALVAEAHARAADIERVGQSLEFADRLTERREQIDRLEETIRLKAESFVEVQKELRALLLNPQGENAE